MPDVPFRDSAQGKWEQLMSLTDINGSTNGLTQRRILSGIFNQLFSDGDSQQHSDGEVIEQSRRGKWRRILGDLVGALIYCC